MKKLFVIINVLLSLAAFAGHERTINSLSGQLGNPIAVNSTLSLTDQRYPFASGWTNVFANEAANGAVVLRYDDQLRTYAHGNWSLTVTYSVIVTNASGTTSTYTNQSLTINYDPTENVQYVDRDKIMYSHAHKLEVMITGIDFDGCSTALCSTTVSNQSSVPLFLNDIYFDVELDVERYYNLSAAPVTTIFTNYQSSTNELEVSWNFIEGAESYDLEWLFIDCGDEAYPFTAVAHDFDWRNATRVNVPNQVYKISMAYPKGILIMRVRGVGIDWDNYQTNGYITRGDGDWTTSGNTGSTSSYTGARYNIQFGLLPLMNWAYSASFAEDGKRMEGAEFYDGMMRPREAVATVNSDNTVLIGQTLYDFEGRPAVGIMPYPEPTTGITFYQADQGYDCNSFDTDLLIEDPTAMSSAQGAGEYYSASSPATGMDAAVADAEGFPYTRVTYMNDGTNRPMKSAAAGQDLSMDGVNETQYFYGTTSQQQLDRLFGNEVGYASHYKKNFVIDPNGVVSVSYIDQSGNVIATALAGEAPANLQAIDNPNGNPNTAVTLTDDLMVNNGLTPNGDGTESMVTLTVTEESDYAFSYALTADDYCGYVCYNICKDCVYDVMICVTNAVSGDSVDITPTASHEIIKEYATTAEAITFTVTLTPGTYRVMKRTTLNQANLASIRQDYIDEQLTDLTSPCVERIAAAPVPCAEDCDAACEDHYRDPNGSGGYNYFDDAGASVSESEGLELIATCKTRLCSAPTVTDPCVLKYNAMLEDMSEGGQYLDNLPDQYFYNETTGEQTINSEYNENGWLSAHDKSTTMIAAINAVWSGTDFTNWAEVKTNWNPDWAELLVPYHPEYCAWNYFCNWSCEYVYWDEVGHDYDTIIYSQEENWAYEMATLYDTDGNVGTSDADYWNPLDMAQDATSAGVTGDNSTYQNYNSNDLNQDPRFAGDCDSSICSDPSITAIDSLEGYLTHFFIPHDASDNPINAFYSVWYVIEDPDDIHLNTGGTYNTVLSSETIEFFQMLHGDGTTEGLIDATPTTGQVTPYQFFRSVYFYYRTLVIEQGFAGDAGVASCRSTYADDDYPAFDAEGYLVADADYPNLTPGPVTNSTGFSILYPRNPLIDIYSAGCDNPTGGELVTLIEGLVDDAATNPNGIDNDVPSDVGCTCQMLDDFATSRGISLTDYSAIATALNDEFAPATAYTSTQVQNWFTECDETTPAMADLTTLGYPEELTCIIDIGIDNLNEAAKQNCEQENLELANYNAYYQYTQNMNAAADQYMAEYTAACLQHLLTAETFTVQYDLHEYYYTLYYYDQAGNLVKTVPPEGVNLIASSTDLAEIAAYRDDFRDNTPTAGVDFTPAQHDMISRYAYNSLQQPVNASQNREAQTSTYESGETSFWYDYLGRMVVSQNSKQAAMNPKGYSYTLYDDLGRVYEVGELHTNTPLETDNTGSRGSDGEYYFFDVISATTLETWITGASSKNDVTTTYYDVDPNISTDATAAFANGLENTRNRVTAVVYDDDPTAEYQLYNFTVGATQPDYVSAYFYSYDIHGNVKQVVQETPPLKTHNQNIKTTTYEYDLVSGNVNAVHYQSGQRDEFHHKYEYDADNRLKVSYTSRDNVHWEKETKQFYYQTGGVSRVEIGDKTVQAMDYAFTINGWLKGMNRNTIGDNGNYQDRDLGQDGVNNASNLNRNIATDAAGFVLNYFQSGSGYSADYTAVNATASFEASTSSTAYGSGITNQYNGNIAGMTTAMLKADQTGAEVQGRAFTYDQLYRIKTSLAYHMNSTALTNNAWQSSYTQDNRYKEAFTYDWNGNIKTVDRYDGTATTAVKTDALTYNYAANSNLLTSIDDTQNACAYADDIDDQTSSNYLYDAIGEMTDDVSERITDIEWTPYGKVKAVHKDQANNTNSCTSSEYEDADVEFLYTAGQQRLCKIVKPHKTGGAGIDDQDNWIYYWYSYDAGGNPMGVYKQSFTDNGGNSWTVKLDLEENGVYGSGRTGIRHADDESDYYQTFTSTMSSGEFATLFSYTATSPAYSKTHYNRTIGYKQYEVSNHLGNVLVTVSDKRLLYSATPSTAIVVDWYTADVQSFADYYVFGAPQTGRAGGSYRYGFNGMETDAEMKGERLSYTTEFRQYDPRVGRWISVDPIVKYWESPYAAFRNHPIVFVDPSGLDATGGGDPKKDYPTMPEENVNFLSKLNKKWHVFLGRDDGPGVASDPNRYYSSLPDPSTYVEGAIIYLEPGGGDGKGNKLSSAFTTKWVLYDGKWSFTGECTGGIMREVVISARISTQDFKNIKGWSNMPKMGPLRTFPRAPTIGSRPLVKPGGSSGWGQVAMAAVQFVADCYNQWPDEIAEPADGIPKVDEMPRGPEMITLYRGVKNTEENKEQYQDALKGTAIPRGWYMNSSQTHSDRWSHNQGNTGNSLYTSWTIKQPIASRFAGTGGVVLQIQVPRETVVNNFDAMFGGEENEYLIFGPVYGATVIKQ